MEKWIVVENHESSYEGRPHMFDNYEDAKRCYESITSDGYACVIAKVLEVFDY